jgi:hypothetical protein
VWSPIYWKYLGIALYSDLGEEDKPVVKWAEKGRRYTIEPDSSITNLLFYFILFYFYFYFYFLFIIYYLLFIFLIFNFFGKSYF